MITILPCTNSDAAAVAALWNAKALDAASCFFGVPPTDAAGVAGLLNDAGNTLVVAISGGAPVGFAIWQQAQFRAIVADDSDTYYRLILAYAADNLAAGRQSVAATQKAQTNEYGWLSALATVTLTPIGFEPIAPDQSPSERVPVLYEVVVDLPTASVELAAKVDSAGSPQVGA